MAWIILGIFVCILAVFAGMFFYILLRRFTSLFRPELKRRGKIVLIVLSAALGVCCASFLRSNLLSAIAIFLAHVIAVALLMELINWILKKLKKEGRVFSFIYRSSVIPLIVAVCAFTYGHINVYNVVETDYAVTTKKNVGDGLRVLLVTDFHYASVFDSEKLNELKNEMEKKNPDIILLGGDIVDETATKEQMQEIFRVLGGMRTTHGIYYIFGNHDRQAYALTPAYTEKELEETISSSGITVLRDKYVEAADGVIVAGREDRSEGRPELSEVLGGVDKNDYIIMCDHQPVEYEAESKAGVDLLLSGHTHDGQIFPAGYLVRLFSKADRCYGTERVGNMQAIVSSGISGWGFPVRTQNHSEYVIVDIKREG